MTNSLFRCIALLLALVATFTLVESYVTVTSTTPLPDEVTQEDYQADDALDEPALSAESLKNVAPELAISTDSIVDSTTDSATDASIREERSFWGKKKHWGHHGHHGHKKFGWYRHRRSADPTPDPTLIVVPHYPTPYDHHGHHDHDDCDHDHDDDDDVDDHIIYKREAQPEPEPHWFGKKSHKFSKHYSHRPIVVPVVYSNYHHRHGHH